MLVALWLSDVSLHLEGILHDMYSDYEFTLNEDFNQKNGV